VLITILLAFKKCNTCFFAASNCNISMHRPNVSGNSTTTPGEWFTTINALHLFLDFHWKMHCFDMFISVTLTFKIEAAAFGIITPDGEMLVITAHVLVPIVRGHPLVAEMAFKNIFSWHVLFLDVLLTISFTS
jgi:hypothetical protein